MASKLLGNKCQALPVSNPDTQCITIMANDKNSHKCSSIQNTDSYIPHHNVLRDECHTHFTINYAILNCSLFC